MLVADFFSKITRKRKIPTNYEKSFVLLNQVVSKFPHTGQRYEVFPFLCNKIIVWHFFKIKKMLLFLLGLFWNKSWFELQCLMIGALAKWKNRLVLMFFQSLAFNEKKGHLMWIACRTIGSFQYKTPSTELQQLQVLTFLCCYKVANTGTAGLSTSSYHREKLCCECNHKL